MEIELPPQVEEMLNRHIESGRYESRTQAICQAIFLLDDLAEWEDQNFPPEYVRKKIQEAIDGPGSHLSGKEVFARLRKEIASRNKDAKLPGT